VEVPDVRGAREADAVAVLEELGFEVEVRYVPRILPLRLGTVDDQAPSPEQVRPRGSTVRIFVWELG
jgi:beta-lactam-binding protein with PASTA domain